MKKLLCTALIGMVIMSGGCGQGLKEGFKDGFNSTYNPKTVEEKSEPVEEQSSTNITKEQVEDEIEKTVEEQEEKVVDKFTIEDSQAVVSKYSDIINAENFHLCGMVNSELEPITLHTDGNERNFLAYRFLWEHDGVTDEIYLISDGHDFKYGDRVILDAYKWFGEDDELGKFMIAPAGHEEAIFISFFQD